MNIRNMKKIEPYIFICILALFTSCSLFEMDNYDEPGETLQGEVVDIATGERVLTDQGSEGIRVRLTETSWGENVTPNPDFYCMSDGTFQNTKLFKADYNIRIDGPFIPLVREDERGIVYADETIDTKISGVKNVKFEVYPKLNHYRALCKEKVQVMGDYSDSFLNITDIQFFISYSSSVGYRARDERWSSKIEYTGSAFNSLLGDEITIQSNGTIPSGRKVFVRAAARINYDTPKGSGIRRWNYSAPMEVMIP